MMDSTATPPAEVINGYSIDLLARALYDARKAHSAPCTDTQWERHAANFPASHIVLMEKARLVALEGA